MSYDVIILGTGGVGSAAALHAARSGARVLGLDRFPPGHDRGSSHGDTRIIRLAYFEHPDYVPLLRRAYELWEELEEATGEDLYREVGLLQVGPPAGEVVPGVLQAAKLHGLEVETLTADDVARRMPGYAVPEGMVGVFERRAGYLFVERCVRAHVRQAVLAGATLRHGETVLEWSADSTGVRVLTDRDEYWADKLIVTAGAWATQLLADVGVPLAVVRKHLHWYECHADEYLGERCPAFLFELPQGVFYGFPRVDGAAEVKVSEHSGGEPVADPLHFDRSLDPRDVARVEEALRLSLPTLARGGLTRTRHVVCMYTLSPDQNFLLDWHPRHPNVVFAAGLSGHGFKFTSALGQIVAQMALTRASPLPIEFLSVGRFGKK